MRKRIARQLDLEVEQPGVFVEEAAMPRAQGQAIPAGVRDDGGQAFPLRLAQQSCLKTPTRAASPILECEEEEVGEGEASRRSHHSTPRSATSGDRDHDVTLYEDIRSSALTIANTEDNDNGTKPLEVEVEVLSSGDVNAMDYREDFDEFGFIEEGGDEGGM